MTTLQTTLEPLSALPVLDTRPLVDVIEPDVDFGRRWTAWLAKGYANDARMQRRMASVFWLATAGIIFWHTWVLVS